MQTTPDGANRIEMQRKVVRTLLSTQVLGGVGMASGLAVGALLSKDLGGSEALAGFGTTAQVLGSALIAIPVARITAGRGRRAGLDRAYVLAIAGAVLVIVSAVVRSFPLLLVGMFLFGGGTTANNQSRYAAVDLATPERRGRDLSLVVWATTIGSVAGPNLLGPGKVVAEWTGLPVLVGSFVFSVAGFGLAWLVIRTYLRPDPLLTARALEATAAAELAQRHTSEVAPAAPDHDGSMRRGLRVVRANSVALQGMVVMALGHLVMVSVMVMTPLHMEHGHAELEVIGFVISMHVLGMFALSPLVGAAVDRWGGRPVAGFGGVVLTVAAVLASRAHTGWSPLLLVALFLLGVGWSCTFVSGSTLLTGAIQTDERPATQGLADVVMGLAGAGGGAVAGIVVGAYGFSTLALATALAAVATVAVAATGRRATQLESD